MVHGRAELLGRSGELAEIDRLLADLRDGSPGVLVIDGWAGTGKTALLTETVRRARGFGATVRRTTGAEGELTTVRGLLGAGPLADLADELRATSAPLVLVLDDAQRADVASLRFLAETVPRLPPVPVLLAVAVRREEPATDAEALDELRRALSAVTLAPRPLGRSSIQVLVAEALGPPDDEFVRACQRATRGNPFLLAELMGELTARAMPPVASTAAGVATIGPPPVAHTIIGLVRRVAPDAVAVFETLAVRDGPAGVADIAYLCDVSTADADAALRALVAVGVVRYDGRLIQPVIGAAIRTVLPPRRRADLHLRTAELLESAGAPAAEVLPHLLQAPDTFDPDVVDRLCRAAATAPPELAVPALLRARPKLMSPRARAEVSARLAPLLAPHDPDAAIDHATDAAAALTGPARDDAVSLAAHLIAGRDGLAAGRESARAQGADVLASSLDVVRTGAGDRPGDGVAAWVAAWSGRDRVAVLATAREVLRRDGLDPLPRVDQLAAALTLLAGGEAAPVAAAVTAARRAGPTAPELELLAARASWLAGDVDAARAPIVPGANPVVLSPGDVLAPTLEAADLDGAREIVARLDVDGPPWASHLALDARGRLRLADGDAPGAVDDLTRSRARLSELGVVNPAVADWCSPLVAALLATGSREEAGGVAAEGLAAAREWGAAGPLATALATSAFVAAEPQPLLAEALALLGEGGPPLVRARVLLQLGADREQLRDALDLAQRHGAVVLAGQAHAALVAAGARPRRRAQSGSGSLTASERRVADLAAAGSTNREISDALFVTQRTVELHLTNAYRKLQISHRHELAGALRA